MWYAILISLGPK